MDTRRDFIRKGMLGATASVGIPSLINDSFAGLTSVSAKLPDLLEAGRSDKVLLLIQLEGGNDGLNTVIPIENDRYYRSRKNIAIKKEDALPLNETQRLHPEMKFFAEQYKGGKLAVINNVGYDMPNRSHFRSGAIWQSALEDAVMKNEMELKAGTGWLGRYFDEHCAGESNLVGVYHGDAALAMRGMGFDGTSISDLQTEPFGFLKLRDQMIKDPAFRVLQKKTAGNKKKNKVSFVRNIAEETLVASDEMEKFMAELKRNGNGFPNTSLGKQLGLISQFIIQGSSTRVFLARIGGFDTHSNQLKSHASLMKQIDEAVKAFMLQMRSVLLEDKVAIMTFSEFGRQLKENGTAGTDHGAAAPMFILGGGVKGGVIGKPPELKGEKVHGFGGLAHEVDFRSVYRSVIEQFLRVESDRIISDKYKPIKLF